MEVGRFFMQRSYNILHDIGEKITKAINEHPNYPIAILASEDMYADGRFWTFATDVKIEIGEVLDCFTCWWGVETVCSDRQKFKEYCINRIHWILSRELGRNPTEEEIEAAWKEVKEVHEPQWKKCILIKVNY